MQMFFICEIYWFELFRRLHEFDKIQSVQALKVVIIAQLV